MTNEISVIFQEGDEKTPKTIKELIDIYDSNHASESAEVLLVIEGKYHKLNYKYMTTIFIPIFKSFIKTQVERNSQSSKELVQTNQQVELSQNQNELINTINDQILDIYSFIEAINTNVKEITQLVSSQPVINNSTYTIPKNNISEKPNEEPELNNDDSNIQISKILLNVTMRGLPSFVGCLLGFLACLLLNKGANNQNPVIAKTTENTSSQKETVNTTESNSLSNQWESKIRKMNDELISIKSKSETVSTEIMKTKDDAKVIADAINLNLSTINSGLKTLSDDSKPLFEKNLFNSKVTEILKENLNTGNLATKLIELDKNSGEKFIESLTIALLPKDSKKIEELKKTFVEKIGQLDPATKNNLINGIIKSYGNPTADEKAKLLKDLLNDWLNKENIQSAIAKSMIPKNQKVVIIPIQDFHPTSTDGMFSPLIKQLLNTEHKIFIYSNDKLTEINQANISELKKNFNNTTSVVDSDFYKESVKATDNKSSDIILIRGPNSPVAPKIDGSAWFNGNHCSVIYINNKTSPTNDSDERKIQWANLVAINRGSLRIVDFDSTKPDETDKTVAQILKEIKEVR